MGLIFKAWTLSNSTGMKILSMDSAITLSFSLIFYDDVLIIVDEAKLVYCLKYSEPNLQA